MGILKLFLKLAGIGLLILVFLIILGQVVFDRIYQFPLKINYGVTFSPQYAKYLGLDWQKTYLEMISDLGVKDLRIPTYWNNLEPQEGQFNFTETDFMLSEAEERGARVILVVGFRQPRWPECYLPDWANNFKLAEKRAKILQFVQKTTERYKGSSAVWAFQVENEPFLPFFGKNCDKGDIAFLKQEVDLVRSLSKKPIIISDSGELGLWITPMQLSNMFGTTLYREVYNPVMGYFSYPILPYLYNLKSQIVQKIFAPQNQKTIIVELQAEPWIVKTDLATNVQKQAQLFPVEKLKDYLNYAQKTGFDTQYLWGVEWWYFMRQNGHPEYLDYAKTLF